nr:NADH dehydrogenase subunit 2 [Leucoptera malifoliella]
MYFNSNKLFFLFIIINSTMISISANSWFGCWIGLEINLLSFIPLISNVNNLLSSEAALKYFLIQSISSMNLMFLIININMLKNMEFFFLSLMLINMPLLMKMGSVPFHFWFINMIEGLSWMNCFLIMTWQKITPLIMIFYLYNFKFLFIIIMINAIIGAIGGLNSISLRKILAFSSINNLSWMISSMLISENLWLLYFFIYSSLNLTIIFMFNFLKIYFFNQLFSNNFKNYLKMMILINLFSLGGLPPFLGFFSKWMTINYLINYNMIFMNMMLIMTSLIMIFLYLRIMYSTFMINYMKLKWFKFKNKLNNYLLMVNYFITLMGLPLSSLLFF